MTSQPASPNEPTPLEIDLAGGFLPDWAREKTTDDKKHVERLAKFAEREEDPRRPFRRGQDRDRRPPRRDGDRKRDGRRPQRDDRERRVEREVIHPLVGWKIRLLPDPRGVEGLARQLKQSAKAYPLFELALMVIEKPERFLAELTREGESSPELFRCEADGSLWISEREAVAHLIQNRLESFYRKESITVDPPKGNFAFVAVCGMSGELLGPPNHHDYQPRLSRLHAERFANMPFDAFKSRIRMARDEETIQKWKDSQSVREVYYPLEVAEGEEAPRLDSPADLERHFKTHLASKAVSKVASKVTVPGLAGVSSSSQPVRQLIRRQVAEIRRYPLPLAHILGQSLTSKGLQIFKAHENITYVSLARPHYLDRETSPVADGVSAILTYLAEHPKQPRAEQWKAILAQRSIPEGGTEATRDAAVLGDLSWLLHQGYVVDYAHRGLEVVKRPSRQAAKDAPTETPKAS